MSGEAGDLLREFDVVVTGDDITQGKPSPEAYVLAARELGVLPAECLVIENAPFGVRAARAAGMPCVAICSTLSAHHLQEADIVIDSVMEIPALMLARTT